MNPISYDVMVHPLINNVLTTIPVRISSHDSQQPSTPGLNKHRSGFVSEDFQNQVIMDDDISNEKCCISEWI